MPRGDSRYLLHKGIMSLQLTQREMPVVVICMLMQNLIQAHELFLKCIGNMLYGR